MALIKIIIFRLLLSVRGIVLGISKFLAIGFIVFTIALFTISDFQQAPLAAKIMSLGLSVIFTIINWFYDDLIFYFQPENSEISLYR